MTDFQELVDRLGRTAVDTIGEDNLAQLVVLGDSDTASATVEVFLCVNDWEHQASAIDSMLNLRRAFLDDVSFDYVLLERDDATFSAPQERLADKPGYAYA